MQVLAVSTNISVKQP